MLKLFFLLWVCDVELEHTDTEVSVKGHYSYYIYGKMNSSHFGPVANSDSNFLIRTWSCSPLYYSAHYAFKPLTPFFKYLFSRKH